MRIQLKVRETAEGKGLNASQLARKANLSNRAVYDIWNGVTGDPGVRTLARIARALNVDTCELFEVVGGDVYDDNRMSLALA